jgi:TolB-like protein/Tfp pilus assembly protein PilF
LENAGFKVWWDGLLQGGDSFLPTTEAALEGADAVVVLWSKTSVASHWVRDEATVGRDRRRLVPLSLDGSDPPLGFRQFQVIDISKWNGRADAPEMQRVASAIAGLSGLEVPALTKARRTVGRRELIAGGVALAAIGGGVAVWKSGVLGGAIKDDSVAVLPFRNLSGDPEQDYFSEGLSEEVRTALSRNPDLRVLAPTSTATAKDQIADMRAVAKALGVMFVLSGTVRQSANLLRITASLVNGTSGEEDWRSQFDKPMADIFQIQGEIADSVAGAMSAQTVGNQTNPKVMGGTSSVKAHDAYLRGNAFYALGSGEATYLSALKQYDEAIAADPEYAEAHSARARVLIVVTNRYAKSNEFKKRYDDAVASAQWAAKLAPKLAITHSTLGFTLVQGRLDMSGAKLPYEKSSKLGWGDARVQSLYAAFAAEMGWKDKAQAAINRAIKLDPLNAGTFRMEAFVEYCARRYHQSIAACTKALALNPKLPLAHSYWGDALLQQGQLIAARVAFDKELDQMTRLTGLAIADHKLGQFVKADSQLALLIKEFGDGSTYQQAQIFAQWSQINEAMQKLLLAREIGDVGLAYANTDPLLDPLRTTPEFSDLLKDLGFG